MRRTISSLLLTLIACGGTTPAPVIQHRPAPTTKVFGGARPVTLQVPDAYDNDIPTPLLILLHGYSASGDVQAAYLQYDKLVNEANMLLAAPNGTPDSGGKLFWNATDACCNFDHADVDDVAYIAKLITDISAQYNVDAKRVYLSGHSNGGFMSYRFACEHPELIAGIAVIAGATWYEATKCTPSTAVSILHIHGDADGTILYKEPGERANNLPALYPGAHGSLQRWAANNHCTGALTDSGTKLDLDVGTAGAESIAATYAGCPTGIGMELWTIPGGSHVPGFTDEFHTDVWTWLMKHPKP